MNADQVAPRPLAVKRRNEDHQRPMASKIVAVLPLLSRFGGKATGYGCGSLGAGHSGGAQKIAWMGQ